MKSKRHYLYISGIVSCSDISEMSSASQRSLQQFITKTEDDTTAADYTITKDMIEAYIATKDNKSKRVVSIEPYPTESEPAMYVVNYNAGWELYPADSRFGVVLAENPTEYLELREKTEKIGRELWFESLQEEIEHFRGKEMRDYNKQSVLFWDSYRSYTARSSSGFNHITQENNSYSRGMWVIIETSRSASDTVIEDRPPLVTTEWGQGYPWNMMMPVVSGYHCAVGCPSVAVSQVLWFFNIWASSPSGLYHSVSESSRSFSDVYNGYQLTLNREDYTYSSPRWSQMPYSSTGGTSLQYRYVSELMLDIGVRLGTYYNVNSSGVPPLLNNFIFLSSAHLSSSWSPYSSIMVDTVVNNLTNRKPVIIAATRNSDSAHHMWIIDGYQKKCFFTKVNYEIWPASNIPEGYTPIGILTESELATRFPDFYPGFSFSGREDETEATLFFMNWGYDGNYRYDMYYAHPNNSWEGYNIQRSIHYNLSPWELLL